MLGRIGYLVSVIGRGGVSTVLCPLITIAPRCGEQMALVQLMGGIERDVGSIYTHLANIDAVPHKHIEGHCHNHVFDPIVIAIEGGLHVSLAKIALPCRADVELFGAFGLQVFGTVMEEIVLVKRGGTEYLFIGSTYMPLGQQLIGYAE